MGEPFVGRSSDVASALEAWERALDGERQLLVLMGEPGIGKTRLASEIVRLTTDRGASSHWGRTWESGGAPALWPWIQILRQLLRLPGAAEVVDRLGSRAAMLEEVIRALPAASPVGGGQSGSSFELFDAVEGFLSKLTAKQPITLVLDDLHAADLSSLELLKFLARTRELAPLLVIATSRTSELAESPQASSILSDIAREGRLLRLEGLAPAETGQLARAFAPELPDRVVTEIASVTGGNPLFVKEMAQINRAAQASGAPPGRLRTPALHEALRQRVARTLEEQGALLPGASVIGRTVPVSLLSQLLGQDQETVEQGLLAAVADGLMDTGVDGREYRFVHDLVRATLYDDLPADRRRELHRKAALLLESQHSEAEHADADLIAHHFSRAGKEWHAKAAEWLSRSGDLSLRRFAYGAAAQRFRRAVELYEPEDEVRCDLLVSLGTAQQHTGDPTGKETLLGAASLARGIGDGDRLAVALVALVRTAGANPYQRADEWIHRIEEALEYLPPGSPALRARLLAALLNLLWEPEDAHRRTTALAEALEVSAAAGSDVARGDVLHAAAEGLYFERDDRQRGFVVELLDVARALQRNPSIHVQIRGRELDIQAHRLASIYTLEEGDLLAFERHAAHVMRAAAELKQPLYLIAADCLRCAKDQMTGHMRELEERAATFPVVMPDDVLATVAYFVSTGWARYEQARLSEMRELFQNLLSGMPRLVGLRIFLALDAIQDDRPVDARSLVAPLFADLSALPFDAQWHSFMTGLAWMARDLADVDASRQIYEMLEPYQDEHVVISFGQASCYLGSVDLTLGIAAVGCGDVPRAVEHLERSVSRDQQIGATAWVARANLELATVARARGDLAGARALAGSAATLLSGTSMTYLIGQVNSLQEDLSRRGEAAPLSLCREGDSWVVRGTGAEVRVKPMRGMEYLARLVAAPGQEVHASDLLSGGGPVAASAWEDLAPTRGTKDALLDERAVNEYRRRITELQAELTTAAAHHDTERESSLRIEMDLLTEELERTAGLGGRRRTFADPDERARVAVTKAIRRAVGAIGAHDPQLARHLDDHVFTGTFCAYRP